MHARLTTTIRCCIAILTTLAWLPVGALEPVPPESPAEGEWPFVEALAAPVTWKTHWTRTEAKVGEANLRDGVRVEAHFPDPDGLLETAYTDLDRFFEDVGIAIDGDYRIVTEMAPTDTFEAFEVIVESGVCRIRANDTEGIRRGIYFLEDELLRSEGPFLALGETRRSPFIENRISRCFFGPIKRPPKNKDELMDDVDYYPDHYLNKLAHDGVNGLWLTIEFDDLCKTSLTPVVDPHRERRLAKLRATVAKCRRYGIKVFIFCIEPRVMDPDHPLLAAHPEIGSKTRGTGRLFCPFSEASRQYLYEAVNDVFTEVPGLGGLINISFGERSTTCLSGADEEWNLMCPTCSEKAPGEILQASLSAMEQGMHDAAPEADLISWLYVPENGTGPQRNLDPLRGIAARTPPGVTCQINFESGGTKEQLGQPRHAGDYWLSYIGPSDLYKEVAAGVAESGGDLGAKLQACNSFEVSTAPFVPVPGHLFQKYDAMRQFGVKSVMQCWYIGNLPSVMNRAAAGVLPFAPADQSEDAFLLQLAQRDWGSQNASVVVRAWQRFADAYSNYPLTNAFQYYGPMHDGISWPLHLKPVHKNLSPVWKLEYPPSGDRIGECFSGSHTMPEMLELCRRLSDGWTEGLEALRAIAPAYADDPNRHLDLTTVEALGIQFRSGYNILRFYDRREKLLYDPDADRAVLLAELRAIVEEEIENATRMIALCEQNPYLGFQAEAEGYQYFPGNLAWRVEQLQVLLETEWAEAATAVENGAAVFPVAAGLAAQDYRYLCPPAPESLAANWQRGTAWSGLPKAHSDGDGPDWYWQAAHDDEALYINVEATNTDQWRAVEATIPIEPTHVYPRRTFRVTPYGPRDIRAVWLGPDPDWEAVGEVVAGQQSFRLRIPLAAFTGEADPERPMRFNVELGWLSHDKQRHMVQRWAPRAAERVLPRLGYGGANPADMGWLMRQLAASNRPTGERGSP